MGLEFQIQEDKVCYTSLKDKCDAIRNLESPKTLRQTRAFCGMVNFLSSFLTNLCRLLMPPLPGLLPKNVQAVEHLLYSLGNQNVCTTNRKDKLISPA